MIAERFRDEFGVRPEVIASAPGRVNLVGEHTDYNDGFVLPMAIDRRTAVAASRRKDDWIVAYSDEYGEGQDLRIDAPRASPGGERHWSDYVRGVARELEAQGGRVRGANLLIGSGVSVGSGLASSAALEIAVARALCALADIPWDPIGMARLAQRAEHEHVGVACGIMDPLAVCSARDGSAMLLDCRSLEITYTGMPTDAAIVVMDTGARRSLAAGEYNARRSVCAYAVARFRSIAPGVRALRDVDQALLESGRALLDATAYRRARHVVEENARPAALASALSARDFERAGTLMNESHASLRELYEVSSAHLDIMCEVAREHPACFGARMTGGGFGGCAIALVDAEAGGDFIRHVQPRYEARTYAKSELFVARADDAVRLEPLSYRLVLQ